MKREELLQNKGYWTAKIQMDLYEQLSHYMDKHNLNKTRFAKKPGYTKGYVTQILQGNFNHRISKLVELSLAINKVPKLEFVDIEDYIREEDQGSESFFVRVEETSDVIQPLSKEPLEDPGRMAGSSEIKVDPQQAMTDPITA